MAQKQLVKDEDTESRAQEQVLMKQHLKTSKNQDIEEAQVLDNFNSDVQGSLADARSESSNDFSVIEEDDSAQSLDCEEISDSKNFVYWLFHYYILLEIKYLLQEPPILNDLLEYAKPLQKKSKSLCEKLGIKKKQSTLEKIIQAWEQEKASPFTWENFLSALRAIEETEIAASIESN